MILLMLCQVLQILIYYNLIKVYAFICFAVFLLKVCDVISLVYIDMTFLISISYLYILLLNQKQFGYFLYCFVVLHRYTSDLPRLRSSDKPIIGTNMFCLLYNAINLMRRICGLDLLHYLKYFNIFYYVDIINIKKYIKILQVVQ